MKNILHILLALAFWGSFVLRSNGQSHIDTLSLKKGEVFDILLLSQNPNTNADLKSYLQTAIPVGERMSYQSLPGFRITTHTKGNLRPELLILAKWDNIKIRESFFSEILNEVEDFHERRRKIWSYFGLRYFEMKEDISFKIHRDHYHVATAYWLKSQNQPSAFYEKWRKEIQKSGGEILIKLEDGKSPFGYEYNPQYFIITSWKDQAAFLDFQERMKNMEMDNIQQINEFILK